MKDILLEMQKKIKKISTQDLTVLIMGAIVQLEQKRRGIKFRGSDFERRYDLC